MIIVESSVLIALLMAGDALHERAKEAISKLAEPPTIPGSVLMETATALFRSTHDSDFVAKKVRELTQYGSLLSAPQEMLQDAVPPYQPPHPKLSLVDCELVQWHKAGADILTFDQELQK